MADTVTSTYHLKFGGLTVKRGKTKKGSELWSWDALRECRGQECPANQKCEFLANELERSGNIPKKCKVMASYLRGVTTTILEVYEDQLEEGQLFRIGMHIIPLYKNLVKMKIEELGVANVVTENDKGRLQINPLYKEIREYIKLIEQMWKSVGITGVAIGAPDEGMFGGQGDGNYYDQMEKDAMSDIHENRGRKLSVIRRTQTGT